MDGRKTSDNTAGQICPRCHHQRQAEDLPPAWQCPNCQIVYHKYTPKNEAPPAASPAGAIIREETYPRGTRSPLPWLGLVLLVLFGGGLYLYDYLRWPDGDKITLFTSDDCGAACLQASDYLSSQGIAFTEKNIDQDADHRARWKRAGGQQVPLAFFGAERIEGYNKTIYQIALTGFKDRMDENLNQTVILFTATGCPACESAVKLLKKHDIEFEEYDIKEPENESVYLQLFGRGTPLIFVGNIRLDGYNEKTLKLALEQVELL